MTWLLALALLLVGGWCIAAGVLFRRGSLRRLGAWYFDRRLPFYARNFPFAAIPGGLIGLALFAAFPLALIDSLWAEYVILACVLISAVALVFAIGFMIKPPRVLKPRWIIDLEIEKELKDAPP
jgi:hypothetical protein